MADLQDKFEVLREKLATPEPEPWIPELDDPDDPYEQRNAMSGVERYHGANVVLPEGMTIGKAMELLEAVEDSANTIHHRQFDYRPYDGAVATLRVMERKYGNSGINAGTKTLFGKEPPERRSVPISATEHISVPWGPIMFPPLNCTLHLSGRAVEGRGPLFFLSAQGPESQMESYERFFNEVEEELRDNSIYRYKAIDGQDNPEFLDLSSINPDQVVFNASTEAQLEANLWLPLTEADLLRELGQPTKRAVLLEGDYGTGKTLAAFLTALKAVDAGWTFVCCRPQDNFEHVMETARLYAPAVVFYEDIDRIASGDDDPGEISDLLDIMDGIQAKTTEIIVVATTNHRGNIHKGMFRPGRFDAVISIQPCDREGVIQLVTTLLDANMLEGVDMDAVADRLNGTTPAFIREAADKAVRYAVVRERGRPERITTVDILIAADEMLAQRDLMDEAQDEQEHDTLTNVLITALLPVMQEAAEAAVQGATINYSRVEDHQYIDTRKREKTVSNGR